MLNIQELANLIFENTISDVDYYMHRSMVVVGNNATGKSTLIRELFNRVIKEKSDKLFYYIDSQNRVITNSLKSELSIRYSQFDIQTILRNRLNVDYFAKEDVFDKGYSGGAATFSELMADVEMYNELFNNFLTCNLRKDFLMKEGSIIEGNETLFYKDSVEIGSISSSEAAKLRLIMETNYAKNLGCKVVVIDEFDDHFDNENLISFMNKLQKFYSDLRFVCVIHNFEAIVRLAGFDAVVYNNEQTAPADILLLDCDDISELGQIYKIRSRYIGQRREDEVFFSDCISEMVKFAKLVDEKRERLLHIEREKLNAKERIMYDYIMEHVADEG